MAANQVAADINANAGSQRATVMIVDTADQSSIRTFATDFRDPYGALDVLVNNAGAVLPTR